MPHSAAPNPPKKTEKKKEKSACVRATPGGVKSLGEGFPDRLADGVVPHVLVL